MSSSREIRSDGSANASSSNKINSQLQGRGSSDKREGIRKLGYMPKAQAQEEEGFERRSFEGNYAPKEKESVAVP